MSYTTQQITELALLNDVCRTNWVDVVFTSNVLMGIHNHLGLAQAITEFNDFNEDNDPYGKHDFGGLEWNGTKVYFKIDYYDQELKYGGDPLADDCRRVMTIMTAEEY